MQLKKNIVSLRKSGIDMKHLNLVLHYKDFKKKSIANLPHFRMTIRFVFSSIRNVLSF